MTNTQTRVGAGARRFTVMVSQITFVDPVSFEHFWEHHRIGDFASRTEAKRAVKRFKRAVNFEKARKCFEENGVGIWVRIFDSGSAKGHGEFRGRAQFEWACREARMARRDGGGKIHQTDIDGVKRIIEDAIKGCRG